MHRKAPELPTGLRVTRESGGANGPPRLSRPSETKGDHAAASQTRASGGLPHRQPRRGNGSPASPNSRKPLRHNEMTIPSSRERDPHLEEKLPPTSQLAELPPQASAHEGRQDRPPPSRGGARTPRDPGVQGGARTPETQACTDGQAETHRTRFLCQGSSRPQTTPSGQKWRCEGYRCAGRSPTWRPGLPVTRPVTTGRAAVECLSGVI